MKISAIIPAAGSGSRYSKNKNKLFEKINGIPVIVHSLIKIASVSRINEIIICSSEDVNADIVDLIKEYNIQKDIKVIKGGKTRQESVFNALKCLQNDSCDFVLIHDGVRPLITNQIIDNAIDLAINKGAVIVAVPTKDTIKKVQTQSSQVIETVDRSNLWNVQTPQIFKYQDIFNAHIKFENQDFTDDSALMEKSGIPVFIVEGSYKNIKITTEEDLLVANVFMNN